MNCYEAFAEIVDDFRSLIDLREATVRNLEDSLSRNLRSEADVVRRLEHQIEQLRGFLADRGIAYDATRQCSKCKRSMGVHEQFSQVRYS